MRKDIVARAKQQRALSQLLVQSASHPDQEHQLLRCPGCGAYWQGASAWSFGAKKYLFRIPETSLETWLADRFVDPDEVLVFVAVTERFLQGQRFEHSGTTCNAEGCQLGAVKLSVFCVRHHIESLQSSQLLPAVPQGRWFGTYGSYNPVELERWLAHIQAGRPTSPAR